MQWNVISGTLTMSVAVLSSYDNAITKRKGEKKSKRDKEQEVLPPGYCWRHVKAVGQFCY